MLRDDENVMMNINSDVAESMSDCANFYLTEQIKLKTCMQNCIKDIYISEYSIDWERNILELIPHRARQKKASFINSVLREVKTIYVENMKDFTLNSILSSEAYQRGHIVCEEYDIPVDSKQDILEENISYNRAIFLRHRSLFAKRYFLCHPIIRYVMNAAHRILPTVICNFERYHEFGMLTLYDFQEMILKDIKTGTLKITNRFYNGTCKALQRSKAFKNISAKHLSQFMRCLTNVFIQQILDVMMRSIDHVINIMRDGSFCPQIEFQLLCENDQLITKPDIEEVFSTYHNIITDIINIAHHLMPLEECLNVKVKKKYIKIALPQWFIENSHRSLQEILSSLFRPVNEHVASVSKEFNDVYTSSMKNRILYLIEKSANFDAFLAYIYKYKEYLSNANSMLPNLYYNVGKLEQSHAKESLKQICCNIINVLTVRLVEHHQDFNRSICLDFEHINSTALDIPRDAESLIQLGEYMSRASKILLKELEQRIRQSIYMLNKLSEITILSDEHIDLNRTAINWLHDIQPVFAQSNTLCEAMKSELEEELQRRINTLNSEVDTVFPQLIILDDMDDINKIKEYTEHYKTLIKKYKRVEHEMNVINSEERLFKFPETEFPKITELKEMVVPFHTLICTIHQWQRNHSVWLNGPFECLDAAVIERKTVNYFNEITEINKTMKSRIKMDVTANKSYKFSGIADDPDPMQQPAPLKLCWQALKNVNEFKVYLPLAVCMCNPALDVRHWKEMSAISTFDLTPNAGTTLNKMIDMNLMGNIEKYKAISLGANKELRLQRELAGMIEEWAPISFEMSTDVESDTISFKYANEIEMLLREHLIKLEEMRVSHFVKPILSDVIDFFVVLENLQELLNQWQFIQLRKFNLKPIFSYPGIETHLQQETSLYLEAMGILLNVSNKFVENASFEGIKKSLLFLENFLNEANEKLERVNKGVKDYLNIKRLSFTRFFFLEDTEIQEILFESIDTAKRHRLAKKCFGGIEELKFNKSNCIQGIIGNYGETVCLNSNTPVSINTECEEQWLIQLEKKMRNTIRENILQYYPSIDESLVYVPIDNFPSMAIVCGLQLYWTSSIEKCFMSSNAVILNSLLVTYTNWITAITDELKNNPTRRHRSLLMSLIIIMLSHKEIISMLLERNITRPTDFEWIAQLKYYCNDKIVEVSAFNAIIKYGYEYNFYQQNIINTPLTDKCFRTILQAYRYHLYSSITGPTETGKTETVRNLTMALAKPFYVINCNHNISYDCMIQTFKGIISCGAWICFENFNKLKLELLSAIVENLKQIMHAVSSNLKIATIEGCNLNLNISGNVCVNISLEQTSKHINLPDNLRVLFRSVSMITPDIYKIAEIGLFAGGFLHAKDLATKLTISYKLFNDYLGEKHRYNLKISSLKTVIAAAIGMKRNIPDENEYALILRSMIDVNIPQLHNADIPFFQDIMRDVFPEIDVPLFDGIAILNALERVCARRFLTLHSIFKLKIIQIIELMYVHRGLILIGNALSGKTEILHTLAEMLSLLHEQGDKIGAIVKLEIIMPGVVDNNALFGYFCDKSGMWKDGLCTRIFRRFAEEGIDRNWLVFDGDLAGTWIENLYTTIDENKMLYLASGERLSTTNSTSIFFETMDISNISPSIISRCGIVYIDSNCINWKSYIVSHIAKHDIYDEYDQMLRKLFDWAIDPCLNFLRENRDVPKIQELHLVTAMINLFEILIKDAYEDNINDQRKDNHFVIWAQAALILATAWGLGGNLIEDSQIRFNTFCTSLWSNTDARYPKPDVIKHFEVTLPNEGLLQDNFYIFKGIGNWKYWGDVLKNEKIPEIHNFNQIYISTINSMKYNYIFLKHIKHRKPFLLYGDIAVGKSCIMHDLLSNKLPKNCVSNVFSFTSMNTVSKTQTLLLSKLIKIRRSNYGPGRNQFCVNFVDDVERTIIRRPEARSVFELFRQVLSYNYCYDTSELSKIFIEDITLTLAVTIEKINENIPSRLLRYFNTYVMPSPTADNIFRIYSNLLLANFKKNQFAMDVTGSVNSMVKATIDIYQSVKKTLRSVPNKLYYAFDMRDISRVINGCSLIQKESVETKITFIRLWTHEILRVFDDRILDEDDKDWLFLKIRDAIKTNFIKDSFDVAFDHLPKSKGNQITKVSFRDLIFGSFMDTEKNDRCKRYEEIASMEILKNKVLAYLTEYNANFKKKLNIVVCRYMLEFLIKISRILSIPGGNIILLSTVGSGRRSITGLAAFIQQQSLFEAAIESYYDMNVWRNNLRRILRECGTLQKDLTYFMSEKQMKDVFLCDISCLLSTGELPDLFSVEDKQSIIEMTRLYAQGGDQNAELSAHSVMTYFVNQCKNRLHFVLCFSPSTVAYRRYLCSHPNFAKYCTVNCYQVWPDQMLSEIAIKHMEYVNVQEEIKSLLTKSCVQLHNSAVEMSVSYREMFGRTVHVTSSAFLHMLKLYRRLMSKKQEEIIATRNRYIAGLEKLELAAEQVKQMKNTLMILKPQLEQSARQTVTTMKEVENENITVEQATIVVKQEEEIANKKAEIAGVLKSECEAELAVAIPILEDAVAALNTLKPTDITLVKAMKNPPDTIKLVMAAVCVMLGIPPDRSIDPVTGKKFTDYWSPSKRILGDMNFLQNLKDYDKDNIEPAVMQIIKKTYMTDNSFMPYIVAKASSAAEGLCKWVRAMVSYDEVAKVVAPKKNKLAAAQKECDEAEAFLNEKRHTLAALNAKLAALNDSLRQTLQKKLNLETEVATCTGKLIKAEKLIASLGGEKNRWMQCAEKLQMNYDCLAVDMLFSCGIIAYMASYNTSLRDEMLAKWKKFIEELRIPYTKIYSFISVLGVESEINHWQLCGLSKNRFSTENAIILNNSEQWCLFIDSQNQINKWIKTIEKKNDLKIIKLTDPDYMTVIERNIQNGVPVLLENVGEMFEIALEPILLKNIYKGETWYIDIGNKSVTYSQNFRFYITSRLTNPNYTADIFNKLTIIDFSMPDESLRDKLLDIVISKERPELQEKFEVFRIEDATNKKVLQQQEDNILSTLSSTTTNILEDENAIQILDYSKTLTVNIMKKQEATRAMIKDIYQFRNTYLQFADHCAGLLCTLNTLSYLNHMYRFSFSWFIQLYITSIETSNRSIVLQKRVQFLKSSFTKNLHSSVCRSLFEKHRLLYSFLLCVKILIDTGQTTYEEVKHFSSYSDEEDHNAIVELAPEWLSMDKWKQICKLSNIVSNLCELANDFCTNTTAWERYCNAVPFESNSIPMRWSNILTRFQKMMLVKIVRRDKVIVEVMRLIEDTIEYTFQSYPFLQISDSYAESNCFTVIIFILPSCVSPLSLVSKFASTKGYSSKFIALSMGEEQQNKAENLIEETRKEGGWIFLQNCHYASSWMSRLEQICENLNLSSTSLDFRLWLSSCSIPDFPISILQNSVKIAHDYPLQLKQSLLKAYQSEPIRNKEFFEGCPGKDKEFSKLLYGLCFFHEIVRERKHFGPQGWNIPYDFDHTDLEISIRQLQDFINEFEDVSFDALLYLIGECNYGGKIFDSLDQKCLQQLLDSFCNVHVISDSEYSFFDHVEHLVPQRCEYRDIVMHINNMPLDPLSEFFASDENALIVKDIAIAREFLESISLLDQVKVRNPEVAQDQVLQAIDEINNKLPTLFNIKEIQDRYPIAPSEPLNAILIYEAELINEILVIIIDSLNDLRSALNGKVILTDSLEDLSKEICNNKIPGIWKTIDVGIITNYLSNYINLLSKRANFVQNWYDADLPRIIRFDMLSCCKRFLSAILLKFSRRYNVSIAEISLDFTIVNDSTRNEDADTYYIHGLYLSGARWDIQRYMLIESWTNVFWYDMPPIRLTFNRGKRIIRKVYECPVYTSAIRHSEMNTTMYMTEERSYITNVPLETDKLHVYWIKRGTALFCQVDK